MTTETGTEHNERLRKLSKSMSHACWIGVHDECDESDARCACEHHRLSSTPDPSASEWRYVETRHSAEVDMRPIRLRAHWDGLLEPEDVRAPMRQIVADHAAVLRLTAAAARTTERLSDLPRYLESNGMGTLASIVEDCLTELHDAAAPPKGTP
jgi:hypothetical protein